MEVFLRKLATAPATPEVATALVIISSQHGIGHGLPEYLAGFGAGFCIVAVPDRPPLFHLLLQDLSGVSGDAAEE